MRRVLLALSLWLLVLSPAGAAPAPHPFLDLQLDSPECTAGWSPFTRGSFEGFLDTSVARSGPQSAFFRYTSEDRWTRAKGYGQMSRSFPAAEAAGRRMLLSGYIRTEGVDLGAARLWITAVDSRGAVTTTDADNLHGVRGTVPWTRFETEMDVPSDARSVQIGILLEGSGAAWFDDLAIELDGKPWVQGKAPVLPRPSTAALSWLRKAAIPVATVEAGHGFDDLEPLRKVVGDARIVSLGEQTHGTREFFQMKHRLLEFLVEEMGFTHFSIEANMPEAYRLNEYVLEGKGDPRQLLRGMYFWTWNTQEVLDMILWMRQYNASGKGPVQFTGFDMQYAVVALNNVRSFLRLADTTYEVEATADLSRADAASRVRRVAPEDLAAARRVHDHLLAKRGEYVARFPADRVDWAIQNARVAVQCLEDIAGIRSRDESMAENVGWILDHSPGAKIVLWAHNAHVAKRPRWMGNYLAQRYGKDMVVLGFAFGTGRYNAVDTGGAGLGANDARPPVPGSVESYLGAAGIPRFVVDLRRVPNGAPATFLKKPQLFRHLGAVVIRCPFEPVVVANDYDGLIWIDETNPSVLLPFN